MAWLSLVIAGFFEVGFMICLGKAKETSGMTEKMWLFGFLACLVISMVLLFKATKTLPIGTSYAVWTGIGAAGSTICGILLFRESAEMWRLFFLSTLIVSIVGLKLVSH